MSWPFWDFGQAPVVTHTTDEGFKYFTGYQEDEIVKPLCIILPQMNGYIKYFKSGGKNMSFFVRDDNVLDKYNEILDKIKEKLNIKFIYLEECKYKVKKIPMSRFISAKLESDSELDSEAESKCDTELMAKLESNSDSE